MLSVILSLVGCEWKQTTQEDQKVQAQAQVQTGTETPPQQAGAPQQPRASQQYLDAYVLETK